MYPPLQFGGIMERYQEPVEIIVNGHEFELNARNTAIIRYIAKFAIHNHVQIDFGTTTGYVFKESEGADELNATLEDRQYPTAIYVPEPTEEVIQKHYDTILALSKDEHIDGELDKWISE